MAVTLNKAVVLLRALADAGREIGLSELSRLVRLPKATTYRLAESLQEHGFVRQVGDRGGYTLGLGLWELGRRAFDEVKLPHAVRPWLEAVAEKTQETALFAILDGQSVVYLEKVDSPLPIQINPRSLGISPLHASAAGKLFLAFDAELAERTAAGPLPRYTDRTIGDRVQLAAELARTKARGWAASRREWRDEMSSIAVPVWDDRGAIFGAITLSGPASRFAGKREAAFVAAAQDAARGLARDLGYRGVGARASGLGRAIAS